MYEKVLFRLIEAWSKLLDCPPNDKQQNKSVPFSRIIKLPRKVDNIASLTAAEALPELFGRGDRQGWGFAVFVKGAVAFIAPACLFQIHAAGLDKRGQVNAVFDGVDSVPVLSSSLSSSQRNEIIFHTFHPKCQILAAVVIAVHAEGVGAVLDSIYLESTRFAVLIQTLVVVFRGSFDLGKEFYSPVFRDRDQVGGRYIKFNALLAGGDFFLIDHLFYFSYLSSQIFFSHAYLNRQPRQQVYSCPN